MKATFLVVVAASWCLVSSMAAQDKTATIYVWLDDGTDTPKPADKEKPASVVATRSLRVPPGGARFLQRARFEEPNKYVVPLQNAPKSIDVGIDVAGYHSLPICDLSGNDEHSIHVRLFSLKTPLAAPECFALKTQYEFLFRREQFAPPPAAPRLEGAAEAAPPRAAPPRAAPPGVARPPIAPPIAPPGAAPPRIARARSAPARLDDEDARREASEARRKAVQHSARLKYADGLLALPNPNRPRKTQSPPTRAMLDRMQREDEEGYEELQDMVAGLFKLYGMEGFNQYVPSKWESVYFAGERRIAAEIEILGTHGTYRTREGVHHLENIDFLDDNDEGGYIITGSFRFKPGTPQEKTGEIRWKVDEQGFRETKSLRQNGQPSWTGELLSGPYFPE
jgi:hypothetical protein